MNAIAGVLPAAFVGYLLAVIVLWLMGALQVSDGIIGATVGAGLAAGTAVGVFWLEQKKRDEEADKAIESQRLAGRALLASDLAAICTYAKESADAVMQAEKNKTSSLSPSLEKDVLLRLAALAALLTGTNADLIVELMHCYQTQSSQLRETLKKASEPGQCKLDFENACIFIVELELRARAALNFSRRKCDSISPPPFLSEEVDKTLKKLGIDNWLTSEMVEGLKTTMSTLGPRNNDYFFALRES